MTLAERLSRLIELLPDDVSVTLPVRLVREWVATDGVELYAEEQDAFSADLTVEAAARIMGRRASTVRSWLHQCLIPEAYKLNRKQWRIPQEGLRRFQQRQREGAAVPPGLEKPGRRKRPPDLGGWRTERRGRAA